MLPIAASITREKTKILQLSAHHGRGSAHADRRRCAEKSREYSISNRAEFEALVKEPAMQQTDKTKENSKSVSANHDAP